MFKALDNLSALNAKSEYLKNLFFWILMAYNVSKNPFEIMAFVLNFQIRPQYLKIISTFDLHTVKISRVSTPK